VTAAAFAALTIAMVMLWLPSWRSRRTSAPSGTSAVAWLWAAAAAAALASAMAAHLVDVRGAAAIVAFAVLCAAARRVGNRELRIVLHALVLVMCAALYLHLVPGFDNPRLVTGAMLAPDSLPYTKYLNFDKGFAGLLLLGLYVPERTAPDGLVVSGFSRTSTLFATRFAITAAVVMVLTLAVGYVHVDPKLPSWWPGWSWSMVFLTALPEEALFRAVVQSAVAERLGPMRSAWIPIAAAGLLFGVAHGGGGAIYMLLASAAGIGYGWTYASTGSIAASILAHAGLNTIHFLFFSYPALQ
jgi:membrane protease YdiL (CAAX protease family)